MGTHRVVVIGAGFAGLNAAKALKKADVAITIIDRRNFHLFQPLLYQVATAGLNPSDIAYPIRSIFRNQPNVERIILAEVRTIDLLQNRVTTSHGEELPFDSLIVAAGATHSYFGHDDWARHAPGLKTIEDALAIRRRILASFERAEQDPPRADWLTTFVVVGAGPTGVELAGALVEIATHATRHEFDRIDPSQTRVVLVEGGDRVLPAYPESLSASAQRQLEKLGVEVMTGAVVAGVDESGIELSGGERLDAGLVLWAAGVKAAPLGSSLGVGLDRAGRVEVCPDLSLPGHPHVYVVGDLAAIAGVPGTSPAAMQQGRHAAAQIMADRAGRPRQPFRFRDKGSLATIGRAKAVADFGIVRFGGFPAWVAWLLIHIAYLIGFRNRLLVLISWSWSYLTFRRGARIITGSEEPTRS